MKFFLPVTLALALVLILCQAYAVLKWIGITILVVWLVLLVCAEIADDSGWY